MQAAGGVQIKEILSESNIATLLVCFSQGMIEMQAAATSRVRKSFRESNMAVLLVCFSKGIIQMQGAGGVQSKEILTREQHGRPICLFLLRNY